MKKIMFIAVLFAGFNSFAEEKFAEEKKDEKETYACCTATLTYKGWWRDEVTVCGGSTPCADARDILISRNQFTGLK